jgi:hypothetical protein
VPHCSPSLKTLEFRVSRPILVPLLYSLKDHGTTGSALPIGRFLIVDLIEHRHLLVVGRLVAFYVLHSLLAVHVGGAVVGVRYVTPKLRSRLGVAFNAIHGMHQPSMNLKP